MVTTIVIAMAKRICFPTDHFTFFGLSAAPAPITDMTITCVEETGAPARVEIPIDEAEKNWESNEWTGAILKIRLPSVFMIRQPPETVPAASSTAHKNRTQNGTSGTADWLVANSARAMIPISFWVSFAPLKNAMADAAI